MRSGRVLTANATAGRHRVLPQGRVGAGIPGGSTVMIGGFGRAGQPVELIDALIEQGACDLTFVNNNAGNGDTGLAALHAKRRVCKVACSLPRQSDS